MGSGVKAKRKSNKKETNLRAEAEVESNLLDENEGEEEQVVVLDRSRPVSLDIICHQIPIILINKRRKRS